MNNKIFRASKPAYYWGLLNTRTDEIYTNGGWQPPSLEFTRAGARRLASQMNVRAAETGVLRKGERLYRPVKILLVPCKDLA